MEKKDNTLLILLFQKSSIKKFQNTKNKINKSIFSILELPKIRKPILNIPKIPRKVGVANAKVSNNIGELIRDNANTRNKEIRIVKILKKCSDIPNS